MASFISHPAIHQYQSACNVMLCLICNQQLQRPKTLPCMHACCEDCLREFIFSRHYDALGHFPCPVCRQPVLLPAGGVAALPDKFHVVGLLDTMLIGSTEAGSWFSTTSTDLRFCFGRYGTNVTDFNQPVGLGVKHCGDIVVTDRRGNRILTFDVRGRIKGAFSCRHEVSNIAVTVCDTVVVAASGSGAPMAIEYDTLAGTRIRSYGTFSRLDPVHGIAVLQTMPFQIAVSSCETGTLYMLSSNGQLVAKFAKRSIVGKPLHLAATSRGDVILSDNINNRVLIIDRQTGNSKLQVGLHDNGPGSLNRPQGVAVDDCDNVIIADSGNQRVVQFSASGKFRGIIADMSRSMGKPVNVACMKGSGVLAILVAGSGYAQVRVYSYVPSKHGDTTTIGKLASCFRSGQTV